MSTVPLEIEATVADPSGATSTVRGQVAVATTSGRILDVALTPSEPPACDEAVVAIDEADWVVFGPGSWFTSVIPHLLVPDLAAAVGRTSARRAVVLNLEPQQGETSGFTPEEHLETFQRHAPGLRLDAVIADRSSVVDQATLEKAADQIGATLHVVDVRAHADQARHDPVALAGVFGQILAAPRTTPGEAG
jgi:uncharacterized cofD-like protein